LIRPLPVSASVQERTSARDLVSPLPDVMLRGELESFRFIEGAGPVEALERPEKDPPVTCLTAEADGLVDQPAADTKPLEFRRHDEPPEPGPFRGGVLAGNGDGPGKPAPDRAVRKKFFPSRKSLRNSESSRPTCVSKLMSKFQCSCVVQGVNLRDPSDDTR